MGKKLDLELETIVCELKTIADGKLSTPVAELISAIADSLNDGKVTVLEVIHIFQWLIKILKK